MTLEATRRRNIKSYLSSVPLGPLWNSSLVETEVVDVKFVDEKF